MHTEGRHPLAGIYWQRLFAIALMAILAISVTHSRAQGIESIISPGKLILGHQKTEDDCKACHTRFDRKAQDGLCTQCHKDVGADIRGKTGYHGREKPLACRTCHTDHKGRDARIVDFDRKKFDHTLTDYPLRAKHQQVECDKCHTTGKKLRDAPAECNACHRKDDVHKGSLGTQCAECHAEASWKETRFDHDTTKFALIGKHIDVKCGACHKNSNYKETPRTCIGCHKKDDDAKGHKGNFGEKCESCHSTRTWKPSSFNHDSDTRYVLRGKHRSTACSDCHTSPLFKVKLGQECVACHKKDDKHKESLGKECGNCHSEKNWKEPAKFDHEASSFPLLGKHTKVECKECHKNAMFKEAPKDCIGCHKKDDKHGATLGDKCAECHSERDWKTTAGRFSHDRTRFPLRNAHAEIVTKCTACHKDLRSFRQTPSDCLGCHKKDDKHEGQLGIKCAQCHSDKAWKPAAFDHGTSRFPLTGRHMATPCKGCHETNRYKDAPQDCHSCHQNQDKHKLRFGMRCETCHNTRSWSLWDFDHNRSTHYRLEGAHQRARCESCHNAPAPKGKPTAPLGVACISCHASDDVHDSQFGKRCEQCHSSDSWKKLVQRMGSSVPDTATGGRP